MRQLVLALLLLVSIPVYADVAIFAGGCFWSSQADFDKVKGVTETVVGYAGGNTAAPNYEKVASGLTNYVEAVKVSYNPKHVSYQQLLDYYWHHIDPSIANQQFCDVGKQYRTIIFYNTQEQKKQAEDALQAFTHTGKFKQIYTEIMPMTTFYPAEFYHQHYYKKHGVLYKWYRKRCGRDQRLKEIWGEGTHEQNIM